MRIKIRGDDLQVGDIIVGAPDMRVEFLPTDTDTAPVIAESGIRIVEVMVRKLMPISRRRILTVERAEPVRQTIWAQGGEDASCDAGRDCYRYQRGGAATETTYCPGGCGQPFCSACMIRHLLDNPDCRHEMDATVRS